MAETRERLMAATLELFRRYGYNGTSVKQVTTAAQAPFGSLYHFFPGGKEELAEAVIATSGRAYQELFEAFYDGAASPEQAISDFFDGAADVLEQTGYIDVCPIGTVALEVASTNDRLRRTTQRVFDEWARSAADRLEGADLDRERADELATALVAAVQGGFTLSRAAKSPEPMRATGRALRRLVESTLRSQAEPRRGVEQV